MKGTKILRGQVLLVGAVVLTFIWTATEWTAWRLAFQPELGRLHDERSLQRRLAMAIEARRTNEKERKAEPPCAILAHGVS